MRVAIVTRRYWPAIGGVERVAMNLGETMVRAGHSVTVVAQCVDEERYGRMTHIVRENKRFTPFARNGVQVVQFRPSRRRRALLMPLALEVFPPAGALAVHWLRRYTFAYYAAVVRPVLDPLLAGADVVHVLGGEAMAVGAVEAARRLGKPVAISPFAHPGHWGFDSGSRMAYRTADVVIATTHADAEVYRGAGVPEEHLEVVELPVPAMPAQEPGGEPPGLRADAPLVVFLGARRPTKGVDVLLAAAPFVWERHPHARIAFVGPGEPLAARDERLLDVGRVSDADRSRWLARAQLLCLPSSSESFGMVIGEAWSQGVPVVVSDLPVLRELVEASGGGLVAAREPRQIARAIAELLDDPGRARAQGQAGLEFWRSRLTPEAVCERHLAIYRRMLAARAARPLSPRAAAAAPREP